MSLGRQCGITGTAVHGITRERLLVEDLSSETGTSRAGQREP